MSAFDALVASLGCFVVAAAYVKAGSTAAPCTWADDACSISAVVWGVVGVFLAIYALCTRAGLQP